MTPTHKHSPRSLVLTLAAAAAVVAACHARPPVIEPPRATGATSGDALARVIVDSVRHEVVFFAGPFHIPAMSNEDHAHMNMAMPDSAMAGMAHHHMEEPATSEHATHAYSPLVKFEWPVAGWYRGFRASLVDGTGRELPHSLMHHLTGVDFDRRQLLNGEAERFMAAGSETAENVIPRLIGVPMKQGQKLGVYAAWHNELGKDFDDAYIRIAMPYVPSDVLIKPLTVFPVIMDVNDVAGESNAFDVPPGRSERKFEFTMPLDGRFIAAGGHMHDYGRTVRLEDVESGKVLVRLDAQRDSAGKLVSMPTQRFLPLGLKLRRGHRYRVVGEYESLQERTRAAGGMALIAGLFVPSDKQQWPEVNPNDPEMVADLESLPGGPRATAPVVGVVRIESAPGAQKRPR
jgi:hypothetical protein